VIGHKVAGVMTKRENRQLMDAKRQARQLDLWMRKPQPPPAPPEKHQPANAHLPGLVAWSVLGGRVIR
jgi:hypothetical protein